MGLCLKGSDDVQANQSIAQLNERLQIALGNAQTIISFRISRVDAEVLLRVLGYVDPEQIKHAKQATVQHPLYSPLHEQWEGVIQNLTKQKVRQFTVKTADDRLASIWSSRVTSIKNNVEELDKTILNLQKVHGCNLQSIQKEDYAFTSKSTYQPIYTY